ncbi:hypothetical protein C7B76_14330 [filamentous cyanobacterium CCP2]|nr:hypothetical protein C7B76_14330 [filamentous cyanobacterium CCP2]
MQYLLIDTHQRPLGTLKSDKTFAVGDTFENSAQSYTVIGLNWFNQHVQSQSLTVIPTRLIAKTAN